MTTTSTSLRVQDASLAGGYRVAGRKLIRVYLETCFRFEETTPLSCFDVHDVASLVCFCTGKGAHLWSFSKRQWICTFGKTSAGHRSSIVSCQLSPSGLYLITGGEDHRVVLWHISKQSAEKIFDFHHAPVTWVSFLGHDETLVSASEDTHGIVYERVEHAVFHQSYPHADAIRSGCTLGTSWVCFGDSHGAIHLWNVVKKNKTYTIAAEPDWPGQQLLSQLHSKPPTSVLSDSPQHHSGAILCLTVSNHRVLLASGSMDHTCKVWSLANLVVDSLPSVQEPVHLSSYIQVWENNPMLKDQQGEAHVGQIEIPPGQEATLLWTCVHEGPVTSVQFTEDAAILVTASLDCTLRLWQVTQGALMFQINTPGPVHHMTCTHEHLYVCTEQRFLKFSLCVGGPRASSKGRRRSSQLSSTSFPRWSTDSSSGSYPKKKSKSILNKDARLSEREQDEEEEEEEGTNASPMFQGHLMHYFPQATKTQQRLHLKSSSASSMARQGMKNSKRRTWKEGTIQGGGASFFVEAFSNAFGNPNSKKINQPMMKPRISIGPSRSVKGNPRRPHSAQKVPKLRSEWNEDTWRRMTMMEDRNEFKGEYEEEQQQKDSEEIVKRNEGPRPLLSRNNPSEAMALNRIHYSVLNTKKSNSPLASSMFTAFTSPKFMLDPSASSSSSSTSLGLVMYGYGNPSPSPSPPPSPTRPLLSDTWIQTMANTFAATRRQRKRRRMVFKNTPLRVHPPLYRRASMRPKTASTRPLPPTPGLSPVTSKPRPPTSLALGTHAPHRHFIPSRSMHRGLVLLSEQEGQGKAPDKTPSQRSTSSPSKKKPSSTFASMRVHRMVQRTGGPIQILGKGKRVEQIQMKPFE